jgi:hypothetical protein
MSRRTAIFLLTSLMVSLASPFNPDIAGAKGREPTTKGWTKILPGSNTNPCTAVAIGAGDSPQVGPTEPLNNLSVNCSDDKKMTYEGLRGKFLPHVHACGATLDDLRQKNRNVTIVGDPTPNNQYHCLLQGITPKQFVAAIKYQQ